MPTARMRFTTASEVKPLAQLGEDGGLVLAGHNAKAGADQEAPGKPGAQAAAATQTGQGEERRNPETQGAHGRRGKAERPALCYLTSRGQNSCGKSKQVSRYNASRQPRTR